MVERYIIHTEPPPKPAPPVPVRVARKSQLIAALRQNARPIVIEDHELARPFARLLRARSASPSSTFRCERMRSLIRRFAR